jgi:hypothetical protein
MFLLVLWTVMERNVLNYKVFKKIMPKKLVGTKTLHEEKLHDLYRPLSAFSTISLLQAEKNCKLSVHSRLTEYHETQCSLPCSQQPVSYHINPVHAL